MHWKETFKGLYHLKGGNPDYRTQIEVFNGFCVLCRYKRHTFINNLRGKFKGSLEDCKQKGKRWDQDE